jgi:hypothetical protein
MDDQRYSELMEKRNHVGLSEAEANELGRMIAEKMGKPYQGYSDIHPHTRQRNGSTPVAPERIGRRSP